MWPEWKKIESAPKDGTKIMIWAPGRAVHVAKWDNHWGERGDKWWRVPEGGYWFDPPTHWMPLPEQPKE